MPFRERLRAAVEAGIILGVKWTIVLAAMVYGLATLLGDYSTVRQRALNGQQAFEFIQQQIAAQQKHAKPPETP